MPSATERLNMSPRLGATFENTLGPVGLCASLQLPNETFLAISAASSAAPAERADAIASLRTASTWSVEMSVRVTAPADIPPSTATNAITVMLR